jgi:hypothetical protein
MEPKPITLQQWITEFINIGRIDARCNKYVIIIFCILAPIPHESIVLSHIIMFHAQDEIE